MGRYLVCLPHRAAFVAAVAIMLVFAASGLITSGGFAQGWVGDAFEGRVLARDLCADCHRIERGEQTGSRSGAPSFQAVADDASITALSLRVFLRTSHQPMPDLLLTEAETDHLIAYILSLK